MAKKGKKKSAQANNGGGKRGGRARGARLAAGRGRMLDQKAIDYARLLSDPCNSALVNPVYPGGDAGFLFRAESFIGIGGGAGETSGVLHWTPGYVNFSGTELIGFGAANGSTASTVSVQTGVPGKSFLQSQSRAARCIGACMKITYAGAESARSGRIHYGHTSSGMLDAGTTNAVDSIAQTLMHYGRTPAETVELIWYPGIGDFEFNDPGEPAGTLLRDRKSALTVAFAGLPAGVGVTVHLTAIYEWRPATGQGIGHNALGKTRSVNSFDDVMDYLLSNGETFVRHAGQAVGHAAGAVIGAGVMSAMSRTFGLMPAVGMNRALAFR
nr:MAG: hypothetical protein [Chemarfal virus 166]